MKNFFFGANGDIANEISNFLFGSKGELKLRNLKDLPFFYEEKYAELSFLKLKISIRPFRMEKPLNLLNSELKDKVLIQGKYEHPINLFFNDKIISLQFEILEQILIIKKTDSIINKNWSKVIRLHHFLKEKPLLNLFYYTVRLLKNFIIFYQEYLFNFIIETAFRTLVEKVDQSKSFNEIYKNYTDFLNKVCKEVFFIHRNPIFKQNKDYLIKISLTLYKNLKIIEKTDSLDKQTMFRTLNGVANSVR